MHSKTFWGNRQWKDIEIFVKNFEKEQTHNRFEHYIVHTRHSLTNLINASYRLYLTTYSTILYTRSSPTLYISPGTQSRYSVIESNGVSMLRIEPVRAGRDDAPYECMAENGVGDAVSAEATLTVYERKYFLP